MTAHPFNSTGTRILAIAVILASTLVACGEDEPEASGNKDEIDKMMAARKAKYSSGKKAAIPDSQMVRVKVGKPGWKLLAESFKKYLEEGYTTNVFQPHANEMIPRPRIEYRADGFDDEAIASSGEKKAGQKKTVHPLEEYTLAEYTLVLTMLGTSQPKAIVTDPKGVGHTVTVNPPTWIGKKRYLVKRISRYNVELESQGERKTLSSIKPPYIGDKVPKASKLGLGADLMGPRPTSFDKPGKK
jgi:hypothetical protein